MIVIRPMQQDDIDGVMEIENAVVEFPWTANIFSDCIKVGYGCWVLSEHNQVLGYGLISIADAEGHILNLCMKPSHQRQGLGRRMMEHLIKQGKYLGASSVFLEVRVSNQGAFDLYRKLNFVHVGERKDYYPATDGREDALVLSLSLKEDNTLRE